MYTRIRVRNTHGSSLLGTRVSVSYNNVIVVVQTSNRCWKKKNITTQWNFGWEIYSHNPFKFWSKNLTISMASGRFILNFSARKMLSLVSLVFYFRFWLGCWIISIFFSDSFENMFFLITVTDSIQKRIFLWFKLIRIFILISVVSTGSYSGTHRFCTIFVFDNWRSRTSIFPTIQPNF